MMPAPRYIVEGGVLVLLDDAGNELADYVLSPLHDPAEVAAWLWNVTQQSIQNSSSPARSCRE
jgi:hypothetical protein